MKFNPLDYCPLCGRKGWVVYHNDYVEELKCRNCKETWERDTGKLLERIKCLTK